MSGPDPEEQLADPSPVIAEIVQKCRLTAWKSKTPPTLQIAGAGAKEKSEEEKSMEDLVAMFPKAEPDYIRTLIHQCKCGGSGSHTACVVDSLLTGNYPKRLKCAPPALNTEEKGQVNEIIQAMFPKVPVKALREVLLETKHQLHPAFTMIYQAVKNINHIAFFPLQIWVADTDFRCDIQQPHIVPDIGGNHVEIKVENKKPISVKVLSYGRRRVDTLGLKSLPQSVVQDLQLIVANMETEARVHKAGSISENPTATQHIDAAVAQDISSGILCGCCYADYPFEQMAQCSDGHLFCTICLQSYAREAVFGHGKSSLNCLDGDCEATFLKRELERCLAKDMFTRYEERCQEEALSLANLTDLVRCPYCDFAAILDPQDKVMSCQNPTCKKETCRYCKEDWEEHIGKSCQEIEKKDETRLRIEFEEKMTQAKIRICWQCKAPIIKLEGCNKMTCRCEAKMCYICREPKIDYNHFCRHVREPGKGCDQCNACSLWTNPEEDDNRAIKEIQEAAKEAHREKGYTERLVGAPDEPKKKKHKGNPKSAVPAQPAVLPLMNVPVVLPLNPPRILQ